jgi:hypothetical protein
MITDIEMCRLRQKLARKINADNLLQEADSCSEEEQISSAINN